MQVTISETGNVLSHLWLCVGAGYMIHVNIKIPEKLINDSIDTVRYLHLMYSKPLTGQIDMKFIQIYDLYKLYDQGGNSFRDKCLHKENFFLYA